MCPKKVKTINKEDGSLKLLKYEKPTHREQYLIYESHHHQCHCKKKNGVTRALFDRRTSLLMKRRSKRRSRKHWKLVVFQFESGLWKKVKNQIKQKT